MRPIHRLIPVMVASFLAVAFTAGYLAGVPRGVPSAYAACGVSTTCTSDITGTSVLQVTHVTTGAPVEVVEPDDGETWDIEVKWNTPYWETCPCTELSASVTANVTWTGSVWSVSCTGCDATNGPIRAVSICNVDSCGLGSHSWAYKLIVDADLVQFRNCLGGVDNAFLDSVDYQTTVVDDGDIISSCSENGTVSPTSQTWAATDNGAFECGFNCNATGPYISILYQ